MPPPPLVRSLSLPVMLLALCARTGSAQAAVPLSRSAAIDAALSRGGRLAVAAADTAATRAALVVARAWQNPVLSGGYSEDAPQYHLALELPLELPGLRSSRIGAARAAHRAALLRYRYEYAAIALDADTLYTRALAARARAALSAQTAADADSLRRLALLRRDAGDASDLDVELASLGAGAQANAAAVDSLALATTLLQLQAAIGIAGDAVRITLTDSLEPPPVVPGVSTAASAPPLRIAGSEAAVEAARLGVRTARRSLLAAPSLSAGFDVHDPAASDDRLLPTVGLAIPLPLFNRSAGEIAAADAERLRAEGELALLRLQSAAEIAAARRTLDVAAARVARGRTLVERADRVARMSLTAYREGAAPITTVLDAQRNAREILGGYVDDVAAAWIATAMLRVLTLTATSTPGAGDR